MNSRTIKVNYLARVEGEGALHVRIRGGQVVDVKFKIFEPPRFFEAFLRGRHYTEAPDITARICGICPVAYQMSACHAMENALSVHLDGVLRALRRLIYCGEWIESHALHVFMLHAPDFLGYDDAIKMAQEHPEIVQRGLALRKVGNQLMSIVGGREVHPVNVRVGGFYRLPTREELAPVEERLKWARDAALETVRWAATLPFPQFEQDYTFVALRHPEEYPFNEGDIVSSRGLQIPVAEYERRFEEEHIPYTNALHSTLKGTGAYLVGPLARYNLNFDRLPPIVQEAARDVSLLPPVLNTFKSIVVRCLEILFACDEALHIIADYEPSGFPYLEMEPRDAEGYGCTEAPRGILYHKYRIDAEGNILEAKIVPPTSQNQRRIEEDLWRFVPDRLSLPQEELAWQCEQLVRNYDPCISCATHFLKLDLQRE